MWLAVGTAAAAFPYQLQWKRLVGSPLPEQIAEADSLTLLAEAEGTITAVRRADGLRCWHRRPGGPLGPGLAVADGRVVFADRWGLVGALRADSGAPLWSMRRAGWGLSHVTIANGLALVAGGDGVLYGLEVTEGLERWRVRTGRRPRGAPAVREGIVYAAAGARRLLAIDLATGRRTADVEVDRAPRFIAAGNEGVFVAGDGAVAVHEPDLAARWSRWLGTELTAPPVVVGGQLLCAGANGFLYSLDPGDGATIWSLRLEAGLVGRPVVAGRGGLVLATDAGELIGVDDRGRPLWREGLASAGGARVVGGVGGRLYAAAGGHLHAFGPAPFVDAATGRAAAADTSWWESRARGDKSGYGWQVWRAAADTLGLTSYAVGWRYGFVQQRSRLVLRAEDLTPLRAERVKVEASQVLRTTLTVVGDSTRLERRLADAVEIWVTPRSVAIVADALPLWLARGGLQPGRRDTTLVLDVDSAVQRPVFAHIGPAVDGLIPVLLRHGAVVSPPPPAAADLPADLLPALDLRLWLDADGREVRTEAPLLSAQQRRVEASVARAWAAPQPSVSLRLDHPVDEPARLDCLRIGLPTVLGEARGLFVVDARQQLELDSTGTTLTVRRQSTPTSTLPVARLAAVEGMAPYLSASLHIRSDHERTRRLARRLVPEKGVDSWAAARVIHDWVHDHMVPADTNVRFKSSLEVLEDLEGTCSEYTVLFAALCRAAGIPARISVGYAVGRDGALVLHIWPQAFVGEWVEVDPSWNAFPVAASHIKTGQGLLHPAHLERLNLSLEWIAAHTDTFALRSYVTDDGPPFLAAAEVLQQAAEAAERNFAEAAAQAARYELATLPWNRSSAAALLGIIQHHLSAGELDDARWALERLQRRDPSGDQAAVVLLYGAKLTAAAGRPEEARRLLEELVARHPEAGRADEALGRLAEMVAEREGCGRAGPYYERLVEVYAGSGWASIAASALRRCAEERARIGMSPVATP